MAINEIGSKYICELIGIKGNNPYNLGSSKGLLIQPPNVLTKNALADHTFCWWLLQN